MTLNDIEVEKYRVSVDFSRFWLRRTFKERILAEINGDRPRQPAYDMKLMLSRVS